MCVCVNPRASFYFGDIVVPAPARGYAVAVGCGENKRILSVYAVLISMLSIHSHMIYKENIKQVTHKTQVPLLFRVSERSDEHDPHN